MLPLGGLTMHYGVFLDRFIGNKHYRLCGLFVVSLISCFFTFAGFELSPSVTVLYRKDTRGTRLDAPHYN